MSGFKIVWSGLDRLVAKKPFKHSQKLMESIGLAIKGQTIRRFQSSTAPDGSLWKASKRHKSKTLLDTGRLRSSISFSATATETHVGTNVIYARIHQLGGKAGPNYKVTLPARPFLGVNSEDVKEIKDLASEFLKTVFKD